MALGGALHTRRIKFESVEEKFTNLLRGIDIHSGIAESHYGFHEPLDFAIERNPIGAKGGYVNVHACLLHLGENLHQRLFAILKNTEESSLLHGRTQHVLKPERYIRILGGIVENRLWSKLTHVLLELATFLHTNQILNRYWHVVKPLTRHRIHTVPCGGVKDVMLQHCVMHSGAEHDAVALQHVHVELCVLRYQGLRRIGERLCEQFHKFLSR